MGTTVEESKEDANHHSNDSHRTGKPAPSWSLYSWRTLKIDQQPAYEDQKLLTECLSKLRTLPPIVHDTEIEALKGQLVQVESLGMAWISNT